MEKPNGAINLSPRLSVYFDILRILAALLVMISHYPLTLGMFGTLSRTNIAYDAVIVFFVLSGYVISYAAESLEGSLRRYTVNRVARILPVAVVAVGLSALLLLFVGAGRPDLYGPVPEYADWPGIALRSITFTNQIWQSNITPFGNGPYWSLSFEVWCYVFYGIFVFTKGHYRWVALLVLAAVLGPKYVIMLPVWLAGSLAYHLRHRLRLSRKLSVTLAATPVVAYLAIQIPMPRDWSYAYIGSKVEAVLGFGLDGAANFGWGYLLALLFSVHVFAVGQLCAHGELNSNGRAVRLIRFLSGYTFSLYIVHDPIIVFIMAVLGTDGGNYSILFRLFVYAVVFVVVYVIGNLVEHKKHLFRSGVSAVLDGFSQAGQRFTKV